MPDEELPRYCAWCGSEVEVHGHDDDCARPTTDPGQIITVTVAREVGEETEVTVEGVMSVQREEDGTLSLYAADSHSTMPLAEFAHGRWQRWMRPAS